MRVFVIDDSETALDYTARVLEAEGFDVATHRGILGSAGPIAAFEPDVILVDQQSEGPDSEKLIKLFSFAKPDSMQLLLYSDDAETELAAAARRCGADGYVQKSGEPDQLVQALIRTGGVN
jgi:DNA-binding NarL/FixJ family response regulator